MIPYNGLENRLRSAGAANRLAVAAINLSKDNLAVIGCHPMDRMAVDGRCRTRTDVYGRRIRF